MIIGAAVKTLSMVEINRWKSNQHEFHGTSNLKGLFGLSKRYFDGEFYYIENSGNILRASGDLTWYDAREFSPDRTEYRFYYTDNKVVNNAKEGDTLVVALCDDNLVKIIIVEQGTQFIDVLLTSMNLTMIGEKYQMINNLSVLSDLTNSLR
jgi:hypothetical protein